jgi:hypothetical protein
MLKFNGVDTFRTRLSIFYNDQLSEICEKFLMALTGCHWAQLRRETIEYWKCQRMWQSTGFGLLIFFVCKSRFHFRKKNKKEKNACNNFFQAQVVKFMTATECKKIFSNPNVFKIFFCLINGQPNFLCVLLKFLLSSSSHRQTFKNQVRNLDNINSSKTRAFSSTQLWVFLNSSFSNSSNWPPCP